MALWAVFLAPADNSSITPLVMENSADLHELRTRCEIFNNERKQSSSLNITFACIFTALSLSLFIL